MGIRNKTEIIFSTETFSCERCKYRNYLSAKFFIHGTKIEKLQIYDRLDLYLYVQDQNGLSLLPLLVLWLRGQQNKFCDFKFIINRQGIDISTKLINSFLFEIICHKYRIHFNKSTQGSLTIKEGVWDLQGYNLESIQMMIRKEQYSCPIKLK